jgi:phospholipid transport system substrate-binding protein
LFVVGSLSLACWAAGEPDPTEQIKPTVAKIVELLRDTEFQESSRCVQCDRIVAAAKERFDFYEMSKRVLGKQWNQLSQQEKDAFVEKFTQLLQYAYIGRLEAYAEQEIVYKGQRIRGKRAEVQTEMVDKDIAIPVSYIMILKGDQWKVYDIVVERISLVRNYMEQFRQILRKEKYAGLMKQLEQKIKELEQEQVQEASSTS